MNLQDKVKPYLEYCTYRKELDAKTVIDKERQDRLLAYDSQLKKEMSGLKSEIHELKKQITELEKKKADNG